MLVSPNEYTWDDLAPQQVTAQVVEVNKYFRNHHLASELLDEYKSQGALKPQLIGPQGGIANYNA